MASNATKNVIFKVWLEIERFDTTTSAGETVDTPGSFLATFESYDAARDYVERATRVIELASNLNMLSR